MKHNFIILSLSSILLVGCYEIPFLSSPHVTNNKSNFIHKNNSNITKSTDNTQTKDKKIKKIKKIKKVKVKNIPKPPKKNIKLKKVQDNNFSPDYMYPETTKPKITNPTNVTQVSTTKTTTTMSEQECINLIGQDRFDKYTQMLGSTSGAIKRCKMIKASQS
jgi:hypothetical protein